MVPRRAPTPRVRGGAQRSVVAHPGADPRAAREEQRDAMRRGRPDRGGSGARASDVVGTARANRRAAHGEAGHRPRGGRRRRRVLPRPRLRGARVLRRRLEPSGTRAGTDPSAKGDAFTLAADQRTKPVDRLDAISSGDSPLRSRRSSSKPPVPKMSRMRAASISAATMFSPPSRRSFAQTPAQTPAKTPAPSVTRVSVSVIGSRRDERLERSIATREKELNVKMRAFTRITSHLATMDEGLKAVDDMVTRVVRVPKRADQRVGYGQTVSSRSSESLHAPGGTRQGRGELVTHVGTHVRVHRSRQGTRTAAKRVSLRVSFARPRFILPRGGGGRTSLLRSRSRRGRRTSATGVRSVERGSPCDSRGYPRGRHRRRRERRRRRRRLSLR